MRETQNLQRAVYNGLLTDRMDVLDYLMKRDQIMPRLNDRILGGGGSSNAHYVDFVGDALPVKNDNAFNLDNFAVLDSASKAASLAQSLKYLTMKEDPKLNVLTSWLVVNLETKKGRALLKA